MVVFCGTVECIGKGDVERETSLASLEKEEGTYLVLTFLASQKWWFSVALLNAPVRGM